MKYKRLLIILSSLVGAVILCFILAFTLFRLSKVELNFKNDTTLFASVEQHNFVVNSGGFNFGLPVFAANKKEIAQNLEKQNPYLKVINIETAFPNKLIVHCAEREELFAIKCGESLYYIVDEELKILKLDANFNNKQTNALLLSDVEIQNKTAEVGEHLILHNSESIIKNISNSFAYNNKTVVDIKGMFKEIKLSYAINYYTSTSSAVLNFITHDNFKIKIDLPTHNLIEKINLMLALIPESIDKYETHELIIAINPNNLTDTYIRYEKLDN